MEDSVPISVFPTGFGKHLFGFLRIVRKFPHVRIIPEGVRFVWCICGLAKAEQHTLNDAFPVDSGSERLAYFLILEFPIFQIVSKIRIAERNILVPYKVFPEPCSIGLPSILKWSERLIRSSLPAFNSRNMVARSGITRVITRSI